MSIMRASCSVGRWIATPTVLVGISCIASMVIAYQAVANTPPEVMNVQASQRTDGSAFVDITYDLSDAEGDPCRIVLYASDDGGVTWSAPITAIDGDVGDGVLPSADRLAVWNPVADGVTSSGESLMVRICADDLSTPGMALIPGGSFEMGRHVGGGGGDELPVHDVLLDTFYMSIYETTNDQYCGFLNAGILVGDVSVIDDIVYRVGDGDPLLCDTAGSYSWSRIEWDGIAFSATPEYGDHPMVRVTWYGAVLYANWRSQMMGRVPAYDTSTWECDWSTGGFRLPSEAEWEYAARGGEHDPYYAYPWGNEIDGSQANYRESGDPYESGTTPVGYYDGDQIPVGNDMVNGYGLYDMAGNVWEWLGDWYGEGYYNVSPIENPRGPVEGTMRVLRGGSQISSPASLRCADRNKDLPDNRYVSWGIRLATSGYAECGVSEIFALPTVEDCNSNGIADSWDMLQCDGAPWCSDCNSNGVPDGCEIVGGLAEDCNANGVPDFCDVVFSASRDCNGNGIPDECDGLPACPWDTTPGIGDCVTGLGDLNSLLSNWGACAPPCRWDFMPAGGDGVVGLGDLNALLSNWGPCPE
jgi:formylglycine-generating enzyme required for sulfatase activity